MCSRWSIYYKVFLCLLIKLLNTWSTRAVRLSPNYEPGATTLSFNGSQYMMISMPEEVSTTIDDIILRFCTKRPSGLLFVTKSQQTSDSMELSIENGQLCFKIDLRSAKKTLCLGNNVNNNRWHTVMINRKGNAIELKLDDENPKTDIIDGKWHTLGVKKIHIGRLKIKSQIPSKSYVNFLGNMQHFVFNEKHYFELAKNNKKNIEVSATFSGVDKIAVVPVTFKSTTAFLTLKHINIYATFTLYFQFKTTQRDGLILYRAGKGDDFIAVELVNGNLHYIFNTGSGTNIITSVSAQHNPLNDNRWHDVAILRESFSKQTLLLDGYSSSIKNNDRATAVHFDLSGPLYVGGAEKSVLVSLPKMVVSKIGFQGCLASIYISQTRVNLLSDGFIPTKYKTLITDGCNGPTTRCSSDACENHGRCIQQWNAYNCDCDMTSYSGSRCNEESIAYKFGSMGGLITLDFPETNLPDTKADQLALGFITEDNDAVITRIDSATSDDFIQMEIVNGEIFVTYNMGTVDHPIGEFFTKIDNGKYHVIRFTRSGSNATLQVDGLPVQTKHPTGKQLNVFNDQAKITIGGSKVGRNSQRIPRPFTGTIAGLVFNGVRILDLAAKKDPRITIVGHVELQMALAGVWSTNVTPLTPTKAVIATPDSNKKNTGVTGIQSTMVFKTTPKQNDVTGDVIYSGIGSGCPNDYESNGCNQGLTSDNIITPIINIHTTPPPPTTTTATTTTTKTTTTTQEDVTVFGSGGTQPCDDEEGCEGSGSGEVSIGPTDDDIYILKEKTATNESTSDVDGSTMESTEEAPAVKVPYDNSSIENFLTDHTMPASTENAVSATPNINPRESSIFTRIFTLPVFIGIAIGSLVILLAIIYIIYKCKGRDEGSYKIDESKNYRLESKPLKSDHQANGRMKSSVASCKTSKKKDIKEWYV